MTEGPLAPLIAIVGCDGSGKSTVSADILAWVRETYGPAELAYLGLRSGEIGNRIKRWPLIGRALERRLSKKAGKARDAGGRIPGLPTALVIYRFSQIRMTRFRRMLALRRRGVIAIADRYPQLEVPGFYDGPGLSAAPAGSALVARLAARERRMYETMASYVPDLVIRLNVDVDTAFARKPDHKIESLRAKVAATPLLTFNHAPIVDLSSLDPYPQVLAAAKAAVAEVLDRRPR